MLIEIVSDNNQIEIIEGLASEIWHEYFTPIIGTAQVDYMLGKFQSKCAITEQIKTGFSYFLITCGDESIGYFAIMPKERELFLSKLYILSAQRNRGYGRRVIDYLEQLATEKKLSKISLTVNRYNDATIQAYKKFGFENTGALVKDIGHGFVMDDFKMEKRIESV